MVIIVQAIIIWTLLIGSQLARVILVCFAVISIVYKKILEKLERKAAVKEKKIDVNKVILKWPADKL